MEKIKIFKNIKGSSALCHNKTVRDQKFHWQTNIFLNRDMRFRRDTAQQPQRTHPALHIGMDGRRALVSEWKKQVAKEIKDILIPVKSKDRKNKYYMIYGC